ncbi:MAG: DUF2484 family protein [Pseudomonadota bacterium]
MTLSLSLACLWAVTACVIAMFPSRRKHWPAAYVLIALGIPLLGYVTYENGPTAGVLCLVAGASILRWPVIYAVRGARQALLPAKREKPIAEVEALRGDD